MFKLLCNILYLLCISLHTLYSSSASAWIYQPPNVSRANYYSVTALTWTVQEFCSLPVAWSWKHLNQTYLCPLLFKTGGPRPWDVAKGQQQEKKKYPNTEHAKNKGNTSLWTGNEATLYTQIPFGAANVGESKGGVWVSEIWNGKVLLKATPRVGF